MKKLATTNCSLGFNQKSFLFRLTACLVLLTFSTLQITWAQGPVSLQDQVKEGVSPETPAGESLPPSPNPETPKVETSLGFLAQGPFLSEATASGPSVSTGNLNDINADGLKPLLPEEPNIDLDPKSLVSYEYDRYSFEEALDLLRPEYAMALIVKSLDEEDLKSLLALPFEVAIVVLHGEIVLFTTGNAEEIGISRPAKKLLKHVSFISHTHVTDASQEGPSSFDLKHAVRRHKVEYVVTRQGMFAYNRLGLRNRGEPYAFEEYLARLHQAVEKSETKNQVKARSRLNEFIREMDLLNEMTQTERELFRASGATSFSDDFNRTSLGADWKVIRGNYGISSNSLVGFNSYPVYDGGVTLEKELASNDYDIQVSAYYVYGGSTAYRGVIARYQDLNNYYYAKVERSGTAKIVKKQNGVVTTLASVKVTVNQNAWNAIRFAAEGNNLKLYFNGALKLETNDTNKPLTSGKVGVYADLYGQKFDDFSVTTLNGTPTVTVDPPMASALPAYVNDSSLTLSGTKPADTSVWIDGAEVVALDASTSWSYTLTLTEEKRYLFSVTAKNAGGKESTAVTVETTFDKTAPAGSVLVNDNQTYTTVRDVTLTLTASDNLSGVELMRFSTDGGATWTNWEAIASIKSLTLPVGDGTVEVRYELKDKADNTAVFTDTIVLDTAAPSGTVLINGGAAQTNNRDIILTLSASDATSGPDEMRFSLDEGQTWTAWEAVAASKNLTLPAGDGSKTVQYELRDKAGNVAGFSDAIILDTLAPVIQILSSNSSTDPHYLLAYEVDGVRKEGEVFLKEGVNTFTIREKDLAGNETSVTHLVTLSPWLAKTYGPFKESSGLLTIEAEHENAAISRNNKSWTEKNTQTGFAGEGYFEVGPDTGVIQNTGYTTASPELKYEIEVQTTGTYYVWVRGYPPNGNSDSLHVGIDGLGPASADRINNFSSYGSYLWTKNTMDSVRASLVINTPGTHTLNVWMREDGFIFDKIILTKDSAYTPAGVGAAESVRDSFATLTDGTKLFYEGGRVVRELTPEGDEVYYRADGSVEKYRYADGREIRYQVTSNQLPVASIESYDAAGTLVETIDAPTPSALDSSTALKLTLEGGIDAYYVNGNLKELRTSTGIRITDFTLDAGNNIQSAYLVYPDNTLEIIRYGVLIRRIYPDSSIMDFTPKGFAVREIQKVPGTFWFTFDKLSQTEIQGTRIFTGDGSSSIYDEKGLLRQVTGGSGERFVYSRSTGTDTYTTALVRAMSTSPKAQSLVGATYDLNGVLQEMRLEDGTKIFFANGVIDRVIDKDGNIISEYNYADYVGAGLPRPTQGAGTAPLQVNRSGTSFEYDGEGFLEKVVTAGGTIQRTAQDTNGDGSLTDETVVDLLLETVGGDKLTDFELDADGNIIKGIITTKEGIKQRIENGVMTGFETVDGRVYDYAANEAILKEWQFRDGTRVLYGGGTISEILFPDGRRLNTIGFSPEKEVESFTEELADGTKKYYESRDPSNETRLVKLITPTGAEIHYGAEGMAENVILEDGSNQTISYARNESGAVTEVTFLGAGTHRTFSPDGTLLNLLSDGVNAEVTAGEISNLFTRFGTVDAPQFSADGLVTGVLQSTDGTKLQITEGELTQMIRVNGTKVNFTQGKIASIERGTEIYSIIEQKDANGGGAVVADGNVTEMRIRLDSKPGAPEFPLIPFLENPDSLLDYANGETVPNYPVTFNGDAAIDSNPANAKFGTGALQLDGSGDYLTIPDSDDFDFGTGDFTIDFWVDFETFLGGNHTFFTHNAGNHEFNITYNNNNSTLNLFMNGVNIYRTWNPSFNTWYHLAFTRSGSEVRMFVDGAQLGAATTNTADVSATAEVRIGSGFNSSEFFKGGIDEMRVSKGVARWTGNFTPSGEAYKTDENTALLLHLDPPKTGPTPLSEAARELQEILIPRPLHDAFGDRFKIRSKLKQNTSARAAGTHTFAAVGNADRDTSRSKFDGSSALFDGDGDFIYSADSPDWHFGAGDFTLDFWTRFDSLGQDQGFIGQDPGLDDWWSFYWKTDNTIRFETETGGVTDHNLSWNWTPSANAWYHIALVRQGGAWRVLIDGKSLGERTDNAPVADYGDNLRLGRIRYQGGGFLAHLKGSLDEFRISKGVARWPGDFTPALSEYEQDTDTSLLLHFSQEEFDSGAETPPFATASEEPGQELFFAKLALDPERGEAAEFGADYLPEWLNVSLNRTGLDQGYIGHDIVTGGEWDDLPSTTTTLADLNGDGLEDRVFVNPSSDYWWVQMNTGQGFQDAVRWNGVQGLGTWDKERYIRFFIGRHPQEFGQLVDMDGDGLADRVLQKQTGEPEWYVQFNNGSGFDPITLWAENVQELSIYAAHGHFAAKARDNSYLKDIQEVVSDLIDMDGDGLPDRVVRPFTGPFDRWFFQKNLGKGQGFADTVLWNGVDPTFYSGDEQMGASLSWYTYAGSPGDVADLSDLIDLTGDGLPDRVLLKNKNSADPDSAMDWYLQKNNGSGFDAAVLWDSDVRPAPGLASARIATAIRVFKGWNEPRDVVIDLRDVTGDGLVDRVTMDGTNGAQHTSWWVEENTGAGFAPAVEWTGIAGSGAGETSITQDNETFHSQNPPGSTPASVKKVSDLVDMNGDKILDRVIFPGGTSSWKIQFGTGSGFLPAEEMQIASLAAPASQINTSRYDYLHVSLKSAAAIAETQGSVQIELADPVNPAAAQAWTVSNLTTSWQDFYLPIDRTKPNAGEVKIKFVPAGADPKTPIYVDNVTFTSFRPPAAKDWLDRFLTEENVLAEINSKKTQTLAQYLGLVTRDSSLDEPLGTSDEQQFFSRLLTAETRIAFDAATSEASEFQTFYGSVSKIENGTVSETTLPDGTKIEFTSDETQATNHLTQTVTKTDGAVETNDLSYGRVRSVSRPAGSPLQYSYEFEPDGLADGQTAGSLREDLSGAYGFPPGTEITVVFDPDTGITERYAENLLISRTLANGVTHSFEYGPALSSPNGLIGDPQLDSRFRGNDILIRTTISYKGRTRAAFDHGTTSTGNKTLTTEAGVIEEYDASGKILFHTTPEGYRYAHTFERARKAVTTFETQTVTLPDGASFTVEVPVVSLRDCDPAAETCEDVHRVSLVGYTVTRGSSLVAGDSQINEQGIASYQDGALISLSLSEPRVTSDETRITFDRIEHQETTDGEAVVADGPETGEKTVEIKLLDAAVFHPDGTVTTFKNGLPFSVTTATGRVIDIAPDSPLSSPNALIGDPDSRLRGNDNLINPSESAEFHFAQAEKLWNELVHPKWQEFQVPGTLPIQMEYSSACGADGDAGRTALGSNGDECSTGTLVTRQFAEGVIELYEGGKIQEVLAKDGERLIEYSYDAEGNPTAIHMGAARRRLESAVKKLKAEIAVEREEALARVADREQVLNQTIEGQYVTARDRLLQIRAQIESERTKIASIQVKGKVAKRVIGSAVGQIQAGLDQVNAALEQLARQRAEALAQLHEQVQQANTQIETETQTAYTKIEDENKKARDQILRQEISPIVYHWYRKILGRDPSKVEYDAIIAGVDYDTPGVGGALPGGGEAGSVPSWLADLKQNLLNSQEVADRSAQVAAIKAAVQNELLNYLTLSEDEKKSYAEALGINVIASPEGAKQSELISLSSSEATAILDWLNARSLHFGQSAYLALEALLTDAGITFDRVELAKRLILIDILTGTLTPLESDELVISLYAMKRVAAGYGLAAEAYGMTFDALKGLYDAECPDPVNCNFRFVVHINGNHYVIITKVTDTEVTYIDPGAGAENQLDQVTITKEEFLETWLDQAHSAWGQKTGLGNQNFGFVLSARAPPTNVSGTASTATFFVLSSSQSQEIRGAFFFLLIFAFIAIVQAIANAVAAIVTAIVGLISAVISGIGTILSGFGQIFAGLFSGNFVAGLQAGFGTILHGLGAIGHAFGGFFTSLHGALLGGIQGIAGSIPFIGPALSSLVSSSAFSGALKLSMIGFGFQGTGVLLDKLGTLPKVLQTVVSGGKILAGIAMLATGNPAGIVQALGLVGGGTAELLNLHTSLSPTVINLISIGAAAAGAFTGGLFDGGLKGALDGFKSAFPFLAGDLAKVGAVAIGNNLGLDWRLTGLTAVPVRATIEAKLIGSHEKELCQPWDEICKFQDIDGDGYRETPLDEFLGWLRKKAIEYGADFVKGLLGQGSTSTGGGDPPPPPPTTEQFFTFNKTIQLGLNERASSSETALDGFLTSGPVGAFLGIFQAFTQNAAPKGITTQNFNDILTRDGLSKAMEDHATSLFSRKSVEFMANDSGNVQAYFNKVTQTPVADLPESIRPEEITFQGKDGILIPTSEDGYIVVSRDFKQIIAQGRANAFREGEFIADAQRNVYLQNGEVVDLQENGWVSAKVENSLLGEGRFQSYHGENHFKVNDGIVIYDTQGHIDQGVITDLSSGTKYRVEGGLYKGADLSYTIDLNAVTPPTDIEVPWFQKYALSNLADATDAWLDQTAEAIIGEAEASTGWILKATTIDTAKDVIKATITDVLRFGDRFDAIGQNWNDMWAAWEEGRVTDAGFKLLSLGGNILNEAGRVVVIGSAIKGLAVASIKGIGNPGGLGPKSVSWLAKARNTEINQLLDEATSLFKTTGNKTKVIGHLDDTIPLKGREGLDILDIPDWSWSKNVKWLDEAVARGDDIIIVTNTNDVRQASILQDEINYLLSKGYERFGNKMIKVRN